MKRFNGFSLVELLIVMALTTLMLTIIFVPFTQSVRMLLTGQGEVGLQSEVKNVLDLMSKDISKAVKINRGDKLFKFTIPKSISSKELQTRPFSSCYIDLWLPEQAIGNDTLINSRINKIDPTLKSKEGREILPLKLSNRFVRYFIFLKNPDQFYNIKKGNALIKANFKEDNPFVVYRAEIGRKEWDQYFKGEDQELFEDPSKMDQQYMIKNWKSRWSKVSKIVHRVNQFDAIEISDKIDDKGNKFNPLVQFYFLPIFSLEKKEVRAEELEYKGEDTPILQEYFYPSSLGGQKINSYITPYAQILDINNFKEEELRQKEIQDLLDVLKSTDNPNERYVCMSLISNSENNPFDIDFSYYGKRYWTLNLESDKAIVPGTDRLECEGKILTRVIKDPVKPGQYKIRYTGTDIPSEDIFKDSIKDSYYKDFLLDICIRPQYRSGCIELCSDSTFPLDKGTYTFTAQIINNIAVVLPGQKTYISGEGIKIKFGLSYYVDSNMKRPQIFSMQRTVELKNSL